MAPAGLDPRINTDRGTKLKELRIRHKYLAALLIIILSASSAASFAQATAPVTTKALSATERALVESINLATIKETVNALAAPDMQGRGTAQPGGDKAAAYLADRFAKLGLKPLGQNNTYFQPVKFKETTVTSESTITVGDQTLKLGPDFFVMPPFTGDENVKANLVFVAYGAAFPNIKRNDLAGLDVRGKVVVLREGPPPEINKDSWSKAQAQINILRGLISKGVAGIVFINKFTEDRPYSESADYLTRRRLELESDPDLPDFLPPFIAVSESGADKLFAGSGITKADAFAKAERDDFTPIDLKQTAAITV